MKIYQKYILIYMEYRALVKIFTVYGEGRPDMFLFKLFKSSLTNSNLNLITMGTIIEILLI